MNHSSTTGAVNRKISRLPLNVSCRNRMKSWPYSKGSDILRETPEMKYVFIEKHQAEFSIQAMCRVPAAAGICGIGGGQG